jgi:hypothetical protein
MKRKRIAGCVLAIFLLITISIVSVVGSETKNSETKESPLFRIRTSRAIEEKLGTILGNIKSKFFSEKLIFIPFLFKQFVNTDSQESEDFILTKFLTYCTLSKPDTCHYVNTCYYPLGWCDN